jgi:hypothetical protein
MEKNRRSNFNYRAWTAAAVSAAFFVPLMVFGGPALAGSAASQYSGSSQYQYKVTLCHHTHSKKHPWVQIRVGAAGARAHLRHHDGDYLGACTTPPPASPATAPKHGKSGSKGKSGDHGNSGSQGQSGNNGHGHGKGK